MNDETNGIQAAASPSDGVRNLDAAFASIDQPWQPHRLTSINDYDVKVAKFHGEFVWHSHPETDELFLVRSGEVIIGLRTGDVVLRPGDVFVVPAGTEHRPRAESGAEVLMFEPKGTVNTGDVGGERTEQLREL